MMRSLLVLARACLITVPLAAQIGAHTGRIDWNAVLPTAKELPAFSDFRPNASPTDWFALADGTRPDGLTLEVRVYVWNSSERAQKDVQHMIRSRQGGPSDWPLKGSHTGRKFAEEHWHDHPAADGRYLAGTSLYARRGQSVVWTSVSFRKPDSQGTRARDREIAAADIRYAEDGTHTVLDRLAKQGLTGK